MREVYLGRRSLLLLLAALVVSGCGRPSELESVNKAIVRGATDAINHQQYDLFEQFFADDMTRHCQASPDVHITCLDDMIQYVQEWGARFPDARMETRMMIAEGDLVAWYGSFVGTNTAPKGDMPATGRKIDSETFVFFRIEEGKIAEMWVTWDNVAILNQLGLYQPTDSEANPKG